MKITHDVQETLKGVRRDCRHTISGIDEWLEDLAILEMFATYPAIMGFAVEVSRYFNEGKAIQWSEHQEEASLALADAIERSQLGVLTPQLIEIEFRFDHATAHATAQLAEEFDLIDQQLCDSWAEKMKYAERITPLQWDEHLKIAELMTFSSRKEGVYRRKRPEDITEEFQRMYFRLTSYLNDTQRNIQPLMEILV